MFFDNAVKLSCTRTHSRSISNGTIIRTWHGAREDEDLDCVRCFPLSLSLSRIIFEQNQADLEHATEELSGYLERDSTQTTNLTEMKQKVQDKYRYCSTRRQVLLDHVTEGYECDYWSV